jgi:hypothetical protein
MNNVVILYMQPGDPASERVLAEIRTADVNVEVVEHDGKDRSIPTLECGARIFQGTANIEMYYLRGLSAAH